jgi:hypothetical protein
MWERHWLCDGNDFSWFVVYPTLKPTLLPATATPLAPTPPRASKLCLEWCATIDRDYCYLVYTKLGISFYYRLVGACLWRNTLFYTTFAPALLD